MSNSSNLSLFPIVLTLVLLLIVALVIVLVITRSRKKRLMQLLGNQKTTFYALLISGISISLLGGFFMFDGDILGDGTAGIASIMGYVGLALILASSTIVVSSGKKSN